jgi:hypothetical protein
LQQQGEVRRAPAASTWQFIEGIDPPTERIPSHRHPAESEASKPARAITIEIPERRERNATAEVFHAAAQAVQPENWVGVRKQAALVVRAVAGRRRS